jgi:hypothetical protein
MNQSRALRYRKLALQEPDKEKAQLLQSASRPSPVVLTIRPPCFASNAAGQNRQNGFLIDGNRLLDSRCQLGGPRASRFLGDLTPVMRRSTGGQQRSRCRLLVTAPARIDGVRRAKGGFYGKANQRHV